MAGADYKYCDVCESKAFYDANLNYDAGEKIKGEWVYLSVETPRKSQGIKIYVTKTGKLRVYRNGKEKLWTPILRGKKNTKSFARTLGFCTNRRKHSGTTW